MYVKGVLLLWIWSFFCGCWCCIITDVKIFKYSRMTKNILKKKCWFSLTRHLSDISDKLRQCSSRSVIALIIRCCSDGITCSSNGKLPRSDYNSKTSLIKQTDIHIRHNGSRHGQLVHGTTTNRGISINVLMTVLITSNV